MNGCTPSRKHAKNQSADCHSTKRSFQNIEEIVQDYIENHRDKAKAELKYFGAQPNLRTTIRVAALAINEKGKRHARQRRIPGAMLEHFRRGLSRRLESLRSCKTFPELMEITEKVAAGVWKNSKLTVYDTTHRIGAYLGVEPDRIYLHAGTMESAKAVGLSAPLPFIFPSDLPKEFRRLKPCEIEDCLCRRKDALKVVRLGKTARSNAKRRHGLLNQSA